MNNHRDLRTAYIEMMLSIEPNITVMLGAGLGASPITLEQQASEFFDRIMRKAYGRSWSREPEANWPTAFGFIEHTDTNLHMHIAARVTIPVRDQLFHGSKIWKKLRKAGDYDCQLVINSKKYSRYITKEFKLRPTNENVFIYKKIK